MTGHAAPRNHPDERSEEPLARRPPVATLVRGLLHPACGPLVRISVHGQGAFRAGLAVLDTGATMSTIDKEVADALTCPATGVATWAAVQAVEGEHRSEMRQAAIEIQGDDRRFGLELIEIPGLHHAVQGYSVIALLGWDFLGHCKLSLDGPAGMFTLELPRGGRAGRRRR